MRNRLLPMSFQSSNPVRTLGTLALVFGLAAGASAQTATAQSDPMRLFSFFVTSEGLGKGADLGGLAGADAHCQRLAAAVGAGDRTWHAYLSTQASGGQPAVNARERIGSGPWYSVKGTLVARDVAELHGDMLDQARVGNNLSWWTALNEKGQRPNRMGETPLQHDIITGSMPDGRAYTDAADHTCRNYTSSADDGSVQLGHADRSGYTSISWNSAHPSKGCSQAALVSTGGAGLLYCFAVK